MSQSVLTAEEQYESLRQAVLGGDESVTPADLDKARGLAEFESLTRQAAASREAAEARRRAEKEADAAVRKAAKSAEQVHQLEAVVSTARQQAKAALAAYVEQAAAMALGLTRVRDEVLAADALAREAGRPCVAEVGNVSVACGAGSDSGLMFTKDGPVRRVRARDYTPAGSIVALLVEAGLITRALTGEIDLAPAFAPTMADRGLADPWPL